MTLWQKIWKGIKIAGAAVLAVLAFLLGRKLWSLFHGGIVKETEGKIENPNKEKDRTEADRVKADREQLGKDI